MRNRPLTSVCVCVCSRSTHGSNSCITQRGVGSRAVCHRLNQDEVIYIYASWLDLPFFFFWIFRKLSIEISVSYPVSSASLYVLLTWWTCWLCPFAFPFNALTLLFGDENFTKTEKGTVQHSTAQHSNSIWELLRRRWTHRHMNSTYNARV